MKASSFIAGLAVGAAAAIAVSKKIKALCVDDDDSCEGDSALKDAENTVESLRNSADSLLNDLKTQTEAKQTYAAQCEDLKKQFLGNLSTEFISIIVDKDDQVVAFSVTMPSLSKALQKAKGSLFPFGWYHILHALRRNDVADALLIGVLPEYRDKGVNAIINLKFGETFHKYGIKWLESTRELEENQNVQNMWSRLERTLDKRARVYKKDI